MVNTDDFIKRLEALLDYYSLNASAFADKIGVQRSSLSHLLSGRNKPSLDFILKILEEFPEVDLYWILNGKGQFPKGNKEKPTIENQINFSTPEINKPDDLFTTKKTLPTTPLAVQNNTQNLPDSQSTNEPQIDKIVVFYTNGTFKTYLPE